MKDTDRVERTVFLDKCMIGRISAWILMTIFDDENKEIEKAIRHICKKNDKAADVLLIPYTYRMVEEYYKLYCKMEADEAEEDKMEPEVGVNADDA